MPIEGDYCMPVDTADPVALLHRIRQQQEVLAALACRDTSASGPGRESLEQFMQQLGELWRQGEVRATHRTFPKTPHYWRTRKDRLNRFGRMSFFGSKIHPTPQPRSCSSVSKQSSRDAFQTCSYERCNAGSGPGVM